MAAFMKVLLSIHEIDYQKVHDPGLLADILNEKNIEAGLDTDLLIELSDYAVKGRYTLNVLFSGKATDLFLN